MAAIERLQILNPDATASELLYTSDGAFFVSVIVTNKSTQLNGTFSIWIAPAGDNAGEARGYIASNIPLAVGQTFETIRFALNNTDQIYLDASVGSLSFTVQGIDQPNA